MTHIYRGSRKSSDEQLDKLVKVFEEHKKRVFYYIRHLVWRMGLSSWVTEDDILGEVALTACQKAMRSPWSVPEDPNRIVAWLMRMALYISLNYYRKGRTEKRGLEAYETVMREYELASVLEEDPVDIRLEFQAFLEGLEDSDKKVLQLYFSNDLTSAEIGRRLGLDPGTVRMKKMRLLTRLYERLMK